MSKYFYKENESHFIPESSGILNIYRGLVKVKKICSHTPSQQPLFNNPAVFIIIHSYSALSCGGVNTAGISEVMVGSWTSIISVFCKPSHASFPCT